MKITDALAAEHTIYLGVFEQIERALPNFSTVREIRTMAGIVEGLLHGHASRETNLAFSALDHVMAQKGELDRIHQDHKELDTRLKQIQSAEHCAEARRLLQASLEASKEHFRLEERWLFPLLEKSFKPETLHELGRDWVEKRPQL